jgi:heme exporter protein B
MRLTASNLTCRRGGREVFAGVSFSVASGELLAIRGRNGAGKSSLLRMVVGLVRVADGQLALEAGDPELTIGEQAHYLGHQDALKPSLSVRENLQFWADFLGTGAAAIGEPLARVGLETLADLPAAYLSAGQRRRLSIARLLVVTRPIWLLDEPLSALDAVAQQSLTEFMRAHLAGGGVILAATHGALGLSAVREVWLGEAPRGGGLGWRVGRWCDNIDARTSRRQPHPHPIPLRERGRDMTALAAMLVRDMRIAVRVGGGALMGVLFFLVVAAMVPFALGPDLALLKRIGPAILWLAALLASLLALDRLFAADHEDGSLDLILMGRAPLELVVAIKGVAHWLTTGLPLVVAAPIIGLFLNLDRPAEVTLVLTLLAGTPALTFIGLIGAAIAVTLRRGGLLVAVLVLPLTVPVLIFGVAAANAVSSRPVPFGTPFTILCALTLASLVVGPFAAAAALRQEME